MAYKPEGYSTVSPYLIVDGAARTIEFMRRVLGGEEIRRIQDEAGRIRHAEVRIGECVVMVADGIEGWPPTEAHVHVYVEDVDTAYRAALEFGATSLQEPARRGDEDRRGGVEDPGGTSWWIATREG